MVRMMRSRSAAGMLGYPGQCLGARKVQEMRHKLLRRQENHRNVS
jgi:hypothetical protein